MYLVFAQAFCFVATWQREQRVREMFSNTNVCTNQDFYSRPEIAQTVTVRQTYRRLRKGEIVLFGKASE